LTERLIPRRGFAAMPIMRNGTECVFPREGRLSGAWKIVDFLTGVVACLRSHMSMPALPAVNRMPLTNDPPEKRTCFGRKNIPALHSP
jgi:hypothetical protein